MYLIYIAASALLVIADFFVKYAVRTNMSLGQTIPVIENVFHITYVKNTGIAFGMFANHPEIMIVLASLLVILIIGIAVYTRPKSHLLLLSFTLMISGGIGNIIDRLSLGYVVDFFDFRIINFAVFNTADTFVVIGAVLFILHTLFFADKKGEKSENHN